MTTDSMKIEALVFDVFGTVVDWRSSIIREGRALGERLGVDAYWDGVRGCLARDVPARDGARAKRRARVGAA